MKSKGQSRLLEVYPSIKLNCNLHISTPVYIEKSKSAMSGRKTQRPASMKKTIKHKHPSPSKKQPKKKRSITPYPRSTPNQTYLLIPSLITQNITFTEEQQPTLKPITTTQPHITYTCKKHAYSHVAAATTIQRAWRNYLTNKIIRKYSKRQQKSNIPPSLLKRIQSYGNNQQKSVQEIQSSINECLISMQRAIQQCTNQDSNSSISNNRNISSSSSNNPHDTTPKLRSPYPHSLDYPSTIPSTIHSLLSYGLSSHQHQIITQAYNQLREYAFGIQLQCIKKQKHIKGYSAVLRKSFSVGSIVEQCIIDQVKQRNQYSFQEQDCQTLKYSPTITPNIVLSKDRPQSIEEIMQKKSQEYMPKSPITKAEESKKYQLTGTQKQYNTINTINTIKYKHKEQPLQLCKSAQSVSQPKSSQDKQDVLQFDRQSQQFQNIQQKTNQKQYEKINILSEQIQFFIESKLLIQLFTQILSLKGISSRIRPYIDKPFSFKRISNQVIEQFLTEIWSYIQISQLTDRLNRKMNPTSLQILRLIRDVDYSISQYDLVLEEQVFQHYRKVLENEYGQKIAVEKQIALDTPTFTPSPTLNLLLQSIHKERHMRNARYLSFERDLKIMYMKAVFNCLNEHIIELKLIFPFNAYLRPMCRELTLALKENNLPCNQIQAYAILREAGQQIRTHIQQKEEHESDEKWVNYMDEVLEIWVDVCKCIHEDIIGQFIMELSTYHIV